MADAGQYLIGVAGLAVYRSWLVADPARAAERLADLARLVAAPPALAVDAPALDVVEGYGRWAPTYDATPNPLIELEEPVVHAMIDVVPPGVALDAACGTGRHTRHLRARGHRVIGVDASPAMLAQAREALGGPGAPVELHVGDLARLPVETASIDVALCALALSHVPDLGPPLRELARVLRPGGRLVVSDFHPLMIALGNSAFFVAADGRAGHVRSYCHWHGAYLAAFSAVGLEVRRCVEPAAEERHLPGLSGGFLDIAPEAFRDALVGLPQALVWELDRARVSS
ncbi:MAG TPA: methyltransferase domain-containing protein [Candidatus Binatia bacterium]|nr:methyltransferase domain-containing protein [Candidatus Binatia bacterium]